MKSLLLLPHQNESIFVFLEELSPLFSPVGNHLAPVTLAACLGTSFEHLFFLQRKSSPPLSDEFTEFLEVILLPFRRRLHVGLGKAALSLLSEIQVIGREGAFWSIGIETILGPSRPLLFSFLLANSRGVGILGIASVTFSRKHCGRSRTSILHTDW